MVSYKVCLDTVPTDYTKTPPWLRESARFREVFEAAGMSKQRLAGLAKLDAKTVGDMLTGRRTPHPDSLAKACAVMGVNPSWITMGREPRYVERGGELQIAPPRATVQQQEPLGVEVWLSKASGVLPDEAEWMRKAPWPSRHVTYPTFVYEMLLHAYRQMRDFRPFDVAGRPIEVRAHARS